jgi:hypothetical protein
MPFIIVPPISIILIFTLFVFGVVLSSQWWNIMCLAKLRKTVYGHKEKEK